jgi:hypothetical protein
MNKQKDNSAALIIGGSAAVLILIIIIVLKAIKGASPQKAADVKLQNGQTFNPASYSDALQRELTKASYSSADAKPLQDLNGLTNEQFYYTSEDFNTRYSKDVENKTLVRAIGTYKDGLYGWSQASKDADSACMAILQKARTLNIQ